MAGESGVAGATGATGEGDQPPAGDERGLTAAEVAERVERGQVNAAEERTGRTLGGIVRANVVTRFNAILGVLLVAVLLTGRLLDATFGFILIINAVIGIGQEVRAKRTLDRLRVLHSPTCRVRRAEGSTDLPVGEIVLGDLLELRAGDQVPADGELVRGEGLEVDESLLTGESDPIPKEPGDEVLSGSFVAAGRGLVHTTAVGADAYARRIAEEAKEFSLTTSGLRADIDRILRIVTWVLIVVAPLLAWSQWQAEDGDWRLAVVSTVAGLVGMVPEGLVLLTSLTLMIAAVTLARRQVLVQELAAVEGLARVDVVCLDKTGTITDGRIRLERVEGLARAAEVGAGDGAGVGATESEPAAEVRAALVALAAQPDPNATLKAVGEGLVEDPLAQAGRTWEVTSSVAFSSARKWSSATFADQGTWVLGAPEVVGEGLDGPTSGAGAGAGRSGPATAAAVAARVEEVAATGRRVLLLARSAEEPVGQALPAGLEPAALCVLAEHVRPDAAETLAYFAAQDVTLKVISGDNPRSVGTIAEGVGLDVGEPVDARHLPEDDDELARMVEERSVYGRVTPHAKRRLVGALQANGHTVAMTGDGVNDVLALKDSDIGVAMGSGASATRAVAQLVLLDDRFAHLPGVVGEGRRVINNIERVANLYLTKNTYSLVLSVVVAATVASYPFIPRQVTLISALTYGIPSFFLALAPNARRHEAGFLRRVLRFSIPAGVITGITILAADSVSNLLGASTEEAEAASVIAALACGFTVLVLLAQPLRAWKLAMVLTMVGLAVLALAIPASQEVFELVPSAEEASVGVLVGLAGGFGIWLVNGRRARDEAAVEVEVGSG